jgi:uncharacterized protein YdcH (DUF465 family)
MKKQMVGIIVFLLFSVSSMAAEGEYAVSKIPISLLKNSNIVIRLESEIFELQSLDRLLMKHHYVITVLNEEGSKFARLVESYDKFNEIKSIEGTLYDASGSKIKSLKSKDIEDVSGYSSMTMVDDDRYKTHNFYYKDYPYTVDYTIEEVIKQTMFFPSWRPVWDEYVSVENSSFSLKVPKDYLVRYKEFNCPVSVVVKEEADKKIYSWGLTNYLSVVKEFASPGWSKITPTVLLAPSNFMIEDYTGNMTDWKELGKFQSALNKGRDILPESIRQKVAELIKSVGSLSEKTRILYNFLQSNTHYVGIQLGIGGWRPFEASYVAAKAYGDCKALSNYMYSLLKEAGIKSYYTLIKAGDNEDDIIKDFPSRQFNHAIVCVPDGKDTIWLECTDQTKAAGYMGGFTGNRHALLITDEGGKLVSTPSYRLQDNVQVRNIQAILDEDATLKIRVSSSYKGMQQDDLQMMINVLSKDKVKESLHKQLDFATYDIKDFYYKENKSTLPTIDESLDITVSNYATITGKRLFIVPNVMTRTKSKLSADAERKYDIQLGYEFKDIDTVEIEIPKGYETEAMPQDVSISSKFGKYNSSVKLAGNKLFYYRHYEHYSGLFPAKDYMELVKFYEAIYKADRSKVVLVKNEAPLKAF